MTPILVIGATGQLARSLSERTAGSDTAIAFAGREQIDLTDSDSIHRTIAERAPALIINAAAYTDVDGAEAEPERAHRINAVAPGLLAAAARETGSRLVHISTDYVFDGRSGPYDEDAATNPLGVYGRTKLEGEEAVREALPDHVIVRSSWIYSQFGRNFVKTMLALARDRSVLRVVDDQIGSPTSAFDLADGLLQMIRFWDRAPWSILGRTFHLAGRGEVSWAGLAREALASSAAVGGPFATIEPISSREWPTAAQRPTDSRLVSARFERAFGYAAPPWAESVGGVVRRLLAPRGNEEISV